MMPHLEAKVTVEQVDGQDVVVIRLTGRERPNGDRHTVTWMDKNDVRQQVEANLRGQTVWTARCGCYQGGAGHSCNSGRCTFTNGYTRPERHGICDGCWDRCGHGRVAGGV